MRRYAGVQRRVLGLDTTRVADIAAGWPGDGELLSYEQARDLILEASIPLGAEYRGVLERAFADRWIDRADNAGRRGGAFCNSVHGVHPYVFVTWTGGLRDAFILAHEPGRAVHGQLTMDNNPLSRSHPGLFAIEAPSTFNELLLARHPLSGSDPPPSDAAPSRRIAVLDRVVEGGRPSSVARGGATSRRAQSGQTDTSRVFGVWASTEARRPGHPSPGLEFRQYARSNAPAGRSDL